MKKALLISHNASLSGAPKLLLNVSDLIQTELGLKTDFLLYHDGPMRHIFSDRGKVTVLNKGNKNIFDRFKDKFRKGNFPIISKIDYQQYDFIIFNTAINGDLSVEIRKLFSGPILAYIHELRVVSSFLSTEEATRGLINSTNVFLAPCEMVKDYLINFHHIQPEKVHVLPYFMPETKVKVREESGREKKFVVGGCGSIELRKGTDLFIQLAAVFKKKYPDISVSFIWQGADQRTLEYKLLSKDVKDLQIEDIFIFRDYSQSVEEFYQELDVFALTSREDPYPLVVLDSANLSIPTICFEHVGGASEFVEGNGEIIGYLDLPKMAEALADYYYNPKKRLEDGKKAKAKLKSVHQSRKLLADKLGELIEIAKELSH